MGLSCYHTQLCPTLCDSIDCSLPGSSVYEIFQAQILESRLPFPTPGDLPNPGIELTALAPPALADGFFTTCHLGCPKAVRMIAQKANGLARRPIEFHNISLYKLLRYWLYSCERYIPKHIIKRLYLKHTADFTIREIPLSMEQWFSKKGDQRSSISTPGNFLERRILEPSTQTH